MRTTPSANNGRSKSSSRSSTTKGRSEGTRGRATPIDKNNSNGSREGHFSDEMSTRGRTNGRGYDFDNGDMNNDGDRRYFDDDRSNSSRDIA